MLCGPVSSARRCAQSGRYVQTPRPLKQEPSTQKSCPGEPQSLSWVHDRRVHTPLPQSKPAGHSSLGPQPCGTHRGCALLSQTWPSGQEVESMQPATQLLA